MTNCDYKNRLHYAAAADRLPLDQFWKRYAAAAAAHVCGGCESAGDKLLGAGWPDADPLKLHPDAREAILAAQSEICLPLIEEERKAFIKAEHGRLQAVVGIDYWDEKEQRTCYFHEFIEEARESEARPDPYDIRLDELAQLPSLVKRVERIGTYSYLAFFNMFPQDEERLKFIDGLWHKLTHNEICTPAELKKLFAGHDDYLKWKLEDPVKVIAPQIQ